MTRSTSDRLDKPEADLRVLNNRMNRMEEQLAEILAQLAKLPETLTQSIGGQSAKGVSHSEESSISATLTAVELETSTQISTMILDSRTLSLSRQQPTMAVQTGDATASSPEVPKTSNVAASVAKVPKAMIQAPAMGVRLPFFEGLSTVKDEWFEISQLALDIEKCEVHHLITIRPRRIKVCSRVYKSDGKQLNDFVSPGAVLKATSGPDPGGGDITIAFQDRSTLFSLEDIGGCDIKKQEIREAVEFPLTHHELYKQIGIDPPRGVLLYGPRGTGKAMLAKAVANHTTVSFIGVVGSEFAQKYMGDGIRMVHDVFRLAKENAPAIILFDEVEAIATARFDAQTGADQEVQQMLMELL